MEAALRRVIEREQPGHGILGEEFGAQGADRDWVWVLDPVDGTRQFAAGLPNFGTLIALCHEGRPVIGVIAHLFYESTCIGVAGRGTRASTVGRCAARVPIGCRRSSPASRTPTPSTCAPLPECRPSACEHPLERLRRGLPRLRVACPRTGRAVPERAEPRAVRHRRARAGGRGRRRTHHRLAGQRSRPWSPRARSSPPPAPGSTRGTLEVLSRAAVGGRHDRFDATRVTSPSHHR